MYIFPVFCYTLLNISLDSWWIVLRDIAPCWGNLAPAWTCSPPLLPPSCIETVYSPTRSNLSRPVRPTWRGREETWIDKFTEINWFKIYKNADEESRCIGGGRGRRMIRETRHFIIKNRVGKRNIFVQAVYNIHIYYL